MAEFVKKNDGSNVKLRVRRGVIRMGDPDGIVAYIKSFTTRYEALGAGHLVELQLFVTDEDLARASGFAPHIFSGAKIRLTLVKDGISTTPIVGNAGEVEALVVEGTAKRDLREGEVVSADDLEDSEPVGEEEPDDDYEEDTEGPPPIIPPASEAGATEQADQKEDKNKSESGEPFETLLHGLLPVVRAEVFETISADQADQLRAMLEKIKSIHGPK